MSSSYKPRKKGKAGQAAADSDLVYSKDARLIPAFPLVSFLWPVRSGVSQWLVIPTILMVAFLFRWAVGLWGYSGLNDPPMHGDFEAQRHWMELTIHLPLSQWYFYDLQYWGLDYPPLTAYHSWVLGKIGSYYNPDWFALTTSRGIEDPLLKIFMRLAVVLSEYMVYVPAVAILLRRYARRHSIPAWISSTAYMAILLQPATLLVDHGHFQFNTVMLGYVVAAMESMAAERFLWACVFFVAALGFKQMALYYAPVIFAYMLGSCFSPRLRIGRLLSIALITLFSFGLLFAPFVIRAFYGSGPYPRNDVASSLLAHLPLNVDENSWVYVLVGDICQIIHRVFPFARGLFEDKVANFWCAVHTFYKLHVFAATDLQRWALLATLIAILPAFMVILTHPRRALLPYALASCAWAFFLFSFQVHEKSVLLPLLPMTLLLGTDRGFKRPTRAWIGLANILGTWTMYPLLKRDGLAIPYFVVTLLWAYLMGLPPTSLGIYFTSQNKQAGQMDTVSLLTRLIHQALYLAMIIWHIGEALVPPPSNKPDLWVVFNALIGAAGFGLIYLWCTFKLVQHAFGGTSSRKRTQLKAAESKKKR